MRITIPTTGSRGDVQPYVALGIRLMVTDEAMRQRAVDLGARIRAEDGIGRPAELLERHFHSGTITVGRPGIRAAVRSFPGERRSARFRGTAMRSSGTRLRDSNHNQPAGLIGRERNVRG